MQKVVQYIERHKLFSLDDKILVALSGGADSVALLRLLLSLGYTCEAAHCNFHLRGAESDRDEHFVRQLCLEHRVTLHTVHFNTEQEAKERHISIEMAARELRYAWFEKTREACSAAVIAVAHHQDDSVETLLLNLIRGTGINGLRGIRPRNGHIVRPLLCLDRKEIVGYLESIGQAYVTDSTNLQDEYTRNKIRLNLLPMMQEINPSVKESILKTAEHLDDAASIYNIGIEEAKLRVKTPEGISIGALRQEAAPETVLFEILHPLGFNAAQVRDICQTLDGQPGKVFATPGWRVIKDRGSLLIEPVQEAVKPLLEIKEHPYTPDFMIPRNKATACFDADKLQHPLSLRLCRQGDSFVPFGMKGRKKVSDYLTDRKFSLLRKERQWVLCCGDDIIWLVGERVDNRFRIDEKPGKCWSYQPSTSSHHRMILSSFCFLKQSESNTANGVSYVRAFCGQPFTQAQHLMHFSATVLHSSPFIMAPAGQCFTQYPQCVQRSASTCGVRGIGTPLLRNLTTLRKSGATGRKAGADAGYGSHPPHTVSPYLRPPQF